MENYNYSDEEIQETIKVFQPYYKEPLTKQAAAEIKYNFIGFFSLLLKLDQKQRKEALYKALEETEERLRGPL